METPTGPVIDGYAAALLDVARAEGDPDAFADEVYQAAHVLEGDAALREVLTDARVPVERKLGVLEDLLGRRTSRAATAALGLVVMAGHARHLTAIASRLAELIAAEEGSAVAEVRAAVALDGAQVRRLEEALSAATGRRVEAKVVLDPELVGGVVAKIGDTVFDGSVRSRLDELREQWG